MIEREYILTFNKWNIPKDRNYLTMQDEVAPNLNVDATKLEELTESIESIEDIG